MSDCQYVRLLVCQYVRCQYVRLSVFQYVIVKSVQQETHVPIIYKTVSKVTVMMHKIHTNPTYLSKYRSAINYDNVYLIYTSQTARQRVIN